MKKLLLPIFAMVMLVNGCQKNDPFPEPVTSCRVMTATTTSPHFATVVEKFAYNDDGNIVTDQQFEQDSAEPYYDRTYKYRDGVVVSADGGIIYGDHFHHEDWFYVGKRISMIKSTDSYSDGHTVFSAIYYEYTGANLTSYRTAILDDPTYGTFTSAEGIFTYEGDNIAKEVIKYTTRTGADGGSETHTYSNYDTFKNIYLLEGLHLGRQSFRPSADMPDVNDVSKHNYGSVDGTPHFSYTYEGPDYPTTIDEGNDFHTTFAFEQCE